METQAKAQRSRRLGRRLEIAIGTDHRSSMNEFHYPCSHARLDSNQMPPTGSQLALDETSLASQALHYVQPISVKLLQVDRR